MGGSCSNGFLAVNNASKKVSVTAGHCSPYNIANDWTTRGSILYQIFGTWSSKVTGEYVDADAGTITINNNVDTFAVIRGNGHVDIPITSVYLIWKHRDYRFLNKDIGQIEPLVPFMRLFH